MLLRKKLNSYRIFYYMTEAWLLILVYPNLILKNHFYYWHTEASKQNKKRKE